jgi:hypothetical protein
MCAPYRETLSLEEDVLYILQHSVKIKILAFWDVMSCSLVDMYQCFGGICYLHLQGRRSTRQLAVTSKNLNIDDDKNLRCHLT